MEHFSTVLAICRLAIEHPNKSLISNMKKLVTKLRDAGQEKYAKSIESLLSSIPNESSLVPSRVVMTKTNHNWGELLTKVVKPPVDKETGAPLARIEFVSDTVEKPIFEKTFDDAISSLLAEWKHADELKSKGIRSPLSCLFYGAPGTGKTQMAYYIAGQLGLPLVTAKLDGLISSFLGTTARNISSLFDFVNRYNCILLLDEFDAIAKLRDDPHELGEIKRVVNTLLQCVDSRLDSGITIAITNHEKLLDSAVWRRFDMKIYVPKPIAEVRKALIRRYLNNLSGYSDEHVEFLTWLTQDFSGADIENIINNLKRQDIINKNEVSFLDKIFRHMHLNENMFNENVKNSVMNGVERLVFTLFNDKTCDFSQDKLALLFERDKSTISRWIRKYKDIADE